jgi:DNA helicase-2/ATP-dependent DNA helicase PcrA
MDRGPAPEQLLEGLTEAQAAAVSNDGAPLCILAGAGSGKTRVLTRRIAWRIATGTADAPHVLALTFTRKAAGELRSRLGQLGVRDGVAAGTFHAVAYAQLRQRWADRGESPPTLLERKAGLLARLLGPRSGRDAAVQPIDLAGEIEWAKARMVGPAAYEATALAAGRTPPLSVSAMAALYERYEAEKRRRGLVDFDDLLLLCVHALRDDTAFAAAQRWRLRHLFVDEYQDVNPTQAALLAGWRGEGDDLCVVGDPNQAIYSWNGADPAFLTDFTRREPRATVVRLDDNFRSSPQVLAVATSVLAGGGVRSELRPHRPDGLLPTVRAFASDRDEARGIAQAVRGKHRPGTPWSRIAVLARTNAQTVLLQEALREAGIPFRVRGGGAFLQQPEVRTALDGLRRAGGALATRVVDLELEAREPADPDLGGGHDGPAADRRAVLAELVRLAREHLAVDPNTTVDGFLAWLTTAVGADAGDTRTDAVDLATFHAAKGLEWPVVFVAGLERGLVPIGHAKTDPAIDEERRLLYVAVTRAEEELHCTWARERTFGSRTVPRQPSPWLDDIQAARAALAGGAAAGDLRDRVRAERRKLRAADGGRGSRRGGSDSGRVGADADPGVLGALKAWRSAAARAAGVPAYVIFHDTTLAAVAEAQPATRASLLSLPGLGPVKAERYGDDLLRVVAEHRAS